MKFSYNREIERIYVTAKKKKIGADIEFYCVDKNKNIIPGSQVLEMLKSRILEEKKELRKKQLQNENTIDMTPDIHIKNSRKKKKITIHRMILSCQSNGDIVRKPDSDYIASIEADGIATEIQTTAKSCRDMFVRSIVRNIDFVKNIDAKIKFEPMVNIPQKTMDKLSEKDKELGCVPDYNIYTGKENTFHGDSNELIRVFGGHFHMTTHHSKEELIRALDAILGTFSVILTAKNREKEIERRLRYGAAGDFRKTSYGIEYRVLSNFWIEYLPVAYAIGYLARQALVLLEYKKSREEFLAFLDTYEQTIINTINNCDLIKAKQLWDIIFEKFLILYSDMYNTTTYATAIDTLVKCFNNKKEFTQTHYYKHGKVIKPGPNYNLYTPFLCRDPIQLYITHKKNTIPCNNPECSNCYEIHYNIPNKRNSFKVIPLTTKKSSLCTNKRNKAQSELTLE